MKNIFLLCVIFTACQQNQKKELGELSFVFVEKGFGDEKASTGGISLIDIDNDHDLDVYVSNGYDVSAAEPTPQQNRLYINDGNGNLNLDELSVLSNADMYSSGSTWGDYNNDGFIDVFISNQRAQNNALYKGLGKGEFELVDNLVSNDKGHSYSANWVDIDADGDLDLYVANGGLSHREEDFLYRNDGENSFQKINSTAISKDTLSTIGGLWRDFNKDGLPDLYASYRLQFDRIYLNKGDWEFEVLELEASVPERYSFPKSAATVGDIDNDGDIDIYQTTLMGGANFMFINDGEGNFTFKDFNELTSIGGHTYGAVFDDFNNDGQAEAAVANWGSSVQLFKAHNGIFFKEQGLHFSGRVFFASTITSGDLTGDGLADLIIPQWPNSKGDFEENKLYVNTTSNTGNWIKIKLIGIQSNRSAIGAKINLTCTSKGKEKNLYDEVSSQQTWRSQSGLIKHFGVGTCENIEALKIEWPSSKITQLDEIKVNQLLLIKESDN